MKKWSDVKDTITALSDAEKKELELAADLIADIIKRREDMKLTQRDLAERTGLKQSAIARLESLDSIPRIDTLYKILNSLDLKLQIVKVKEKVVI